MESILANIPLYPICVMLLPSFFNIESFFKKKVTLKEMLFISFLLGLSQLTGLKIPSETDSIYEWLGFLLLTVTYLPCTLAGMYYFIHRKNKR